MPSEPSSAATKASSSAARSSGLVALSRPMVLVRSAPGGAEQNEPAPWVGHTATSSGRVSSRCSDRYWARASSSVRAGSTRSVRAAAPTISDPPVNTPTGCVAVEQQVREVLVGVPGCAQGPQPQPAQVDLVAVAQPGVGERPRPGGRGEQVRAVGAARSTGAGEEVGVQVGVGRERDA